MLKVTIFIAVFCLVSGDEARRKAPEDPFTVINKHISHTLDYDYLWPWSQLMRAAARAALADEHYLEEPQIHTDSKQFEVRMSVKRFLADELRVKVKNRYIIVEGKHKPKTEQHTYMVNHFVQRFALPAGSKQEEVTAVLNEKGVLTVSVPKHEVPPPLPERIVPIEVLQPAKPVDPPADDKTEKLTSSEKPDKTEKPDKSSEEAVEVTTMKKPEPTTAPAPVETVETTHIGKTRKKELKTAPRASKDNEVTKGVDSNGLDYLLTEPEE